MIEDPVHGRSTFSTAPAPVEIPHASGPRGSIGASGATGTSAFAAHTEYVANEDWPKKWLCSGDPSSRRNVVVPSARAPLTTSGPSDRQYRGWPSRQFRHVPHHGQPITTLSPAATLDTPAPTAATMPAPSWPSTPGAGNGMSPSRASASVWQTPDATIRTSTSPAPGSSSSTSATVSGVNSFSNTAAVTRMTLTLHRGPDRRAG